LAFADEVRGSELWSSDESAAEQDLGHDQSADGSEAVAVLADRRFARDVRPGSRVDEAFSREQ
jgi:hypothetical protein